MTKTRNRARKITWIVFVSSLWVLGPINSFAQFLAEDISSVLRAGKVSPNVYENQYFGLTLTVKNAKFKAGSVINAKEKRARLVDAFVDSASWNDRLTISILVDSKLQNPLVQSADQYVRAVRHQFEREGMATVNAETPMDISGVTFIGSILKVRGQGGEYVRGIYTTFLKGYIFTIDVTAPSPIRSNEIVQQAVRIQLAKK